jgi:hypothetical protein
MAIRKLEKRTDLTLADITAMRDEIVNLVADVAALRASVVGITAQLDLDATVTDTTYASNNDPAAQASANPAAITLV